MKESTLILYKMMAFILQTLFLIPQGCHHKQDKDSKGEEMNHRTIQSYNIQGEIKQGNGSSVRKSDS